MFRSVVDIPTEVGNTGDMSETSETNTKSIGWDCNTCGQGVCLECFEEIGGGIECCPMPEGAQFMLDAWHLVTENTCSAHCLECEKYRK